MGPLHSIKVVEFAGLGPGPLAAMLMADLGAHIVRVQRPMDAEEKPSPPDPVMRGRDAVTLNLKRQGDIEQALQLIAAADALVEGFRPGVMESLGLGPAICLGLNERLVYARMTGWGQSGPLAQRAGHDINYIALSGALDRIGRRGQPPTVPLNLVGDYGGGALYLAFGLVSALLDARATGKGQVLDVAMVDGVASLLTKQYGLLAAGEVRPGRAQNLLDGGAPFYDVYACADGRFVAVGAIEPKFYDELLRGLGLDKREVPPREDRNNWDALRALFGDCFKRRTRDEWSVQFEDTDACVTPVLSMDEAPAHPHMRSRETFQDLDGVIQPGSAPRFSGMPSRRLSAPGITAVKDVLRKWASLSRQ